MYRIYCLMGKSASGKDTVYQRLLEDGRLQLRPVIPYTTRPMREGEQEGREYYFRSREDFETALEEDRVIEHRVYQTVYGPWIYYTADDGQIDLSKSNTLLIGTPASCQSLRRYFGDGAVVPLYLYVEDGERLQRALDRERAQTEPRYAELCRRFLADEKDFAPEELRRAGVEQVIENRDRQQCLQEIRDRILRDRERT